MPLGGQGFARFGRVRAEHVCTTWPNIATSCESEAKQTHLFVVRHLCCSVSHAHSKPRRARRKQSVINWMRICGIRAIWPIAAGPSGGWRRGAGEQDRLHLGKQCNTREIQRSDARTVELPNGNPVSWVENCTARQCTTSYSNKSLLVIVCDNKRPNRTTHVLDKIDPEHSIYN